MTARSGEEANAATLAKTSSKLAALVKVGVRQLLTETYAANDKRSKTLYWVDGHGGLGNQLGGLAGALIIAGCTGRRVKAGPRVQQSAANWLW